MNKQEKIRLWLETGVVATGLILYFVCGAILLKGYNQAIKTWIGSH